MTLDELNTLSPEAAKTILIQCCGSTSWVEQMVRRRPYENEQDLFFAAGNIWFACSRKDWLEAYSHHPDDISTFEKDFVQERIEQEARPPVSTEIQEKLVKLYQKYKDRFGYVFIVGSKGISIEEILRIGELRLKNNAYDEIRISTSEQNKITKEKLKQLLS